MQTLTELLGSTLGLLAVVCGLILWMCWPIMTLYAFFRVLRDVRRIADALEQTTTYSAKTVSRQLVEPQPVAVSQPAAVSNSMFGR